MESDEDRQGAGPSGTALSPAWDEGVRLGSVPLGKMHSGSEFWEKKKDGWGGDKELRYRKGR